MDEECRKHVPDPRRGKNVWAVGMLCAVYDRDMEKVQTEIRNKLGRKLLKKLFVYAGEEHPHQAQKPEAYELGKR